MAKFDVSSPVFNCELEKFNTGERAHANTFNSRVEQLINNDAALKKEIDNQSAGKADKVHSHKAADISDFPTEMKANGGNADTVDGKHASDLQNYYNLINKPASLKNPYSLTMQFNGSTQKTYDGSSSQILNITPSGIGAAAGSHTHANDFFSNNGNLGTPYIDTNKYPRLSDVDKSCCLYILNGKSTCSDAPHNGSGYCLTITGNGHRKQLYFDYASASVYQRYKVSSGSYEAWTKINDGGNADTVDGYHAYQFQNYGSDGKPEGTYLKSQYDGSKGKFYIKAYDKDSGNYLTGVYVDYAANSDMLQDKHANDFVSDSPAGGRNYTTVLEWALAQTSSAVSFSTSGSSFADAEDRPTNKQYREFSYLLLKGEGSRRTVIAFEYGMTGKNIYRRCISGSTWYDGWVRIITNETLTYKETDPGSISDGCTVMFPE